MSCVLDASALLCLLFQEKGVERVEELLDDAQISAVNYAEVLTKLIDRGLGAEDAVTSLATLGLTIVEVDQSLAEDIARLRGPTQRLGLSLGDRTCLALARRLDLPAITADRAWSKIGHDVGIRIEVLR